VVAVMEFTAQVGSYPQDRLVNRCPSFRRTDDDS
jgi:hypothetical protein